MVRLIDADALHAKIIKDAEQMEDYVGRMFTYAAANELQRAPTAKAIPVWWIQAQIDKFHAEFEEIAGIIDYEDYADKILSQMYAIRGLLNKWNAEREEE